MFKLLHPWVFLLIPLPFLIRAYLPKYQGQQFSVLPVPFFASLKNIAKNKNAVHVELENNFWFAFIIWVLLLISISGPVWLGKAIQLPRSGRDILMAIDISGSMQIPDMRANGHAAQRLDIVKQVATNFITQRAGDRLGLILFGSRAYLQTPLTFDLKTVKTILDDATVGLAGPQTSIGDAIAIAIKQLKKFPQDSRVLVLLTDGVNNAGHVLPLDAAKMAKEYGIKIHTIGLGSDHMYVDGMFGPELINPSYELDEKTLKKISQMTNGIYFRAFNQDDLKKVYRELNRLEPRAGDNEVLHPIVELYVWPLSSALLLSTILFWFYHKR